MSDDDRHVTERDFAAFRELLDERLRRTETRMLLYIGAAVGLLRFDFPDKVTAAAIGLMVLKGLASFAWWK